jgi:hypothetical protein
MGITMKMRSTASVVAVLALSALLSGCGSSSKDTTTTTSTAATPTTTFVYTSDAHYGIKRGLAFSGLSSAQQVNGAMILEINRLQSASVALPGDAGVNAGKALSAVDFVVETGDAVNRADSNVYPYAKALAKDVWPLFKADYFTALNVKNSAGTKAPLYMTPGNHDVSNAIGYYKTPLNTDAGIDATSYVEIYNLMNPTTTISTSSFTSAATAATSYASKRVVTSRDVNGVHFLFVGMWPDSIARPLIDANLATVAATTPVIIFTHDQPTSEAKHFTNPNATTLPVTPINATNKFENLLSDTYADTQGAGNTPGTSTDIEQRTFVAWLKTHKNIVAYFHGNDNRNEFYTYTGPDNDISLPVFRVDSPMKGSITGNDAADGKGDPTKLSFQVISIDTDAKKMTVREYLWNTKAWGTFTTVSLTPRSL